eukprot:SM000013S26423  [mRNA]  locus=s13:336904:342893:+ [translate_table: standard]
MGTQSSLRNFFAARRAKDEVSSGEGTGAGQDVGASQSQLLQLESPCLTTGIRVSPVRKRRTCLVPRVKIVLDEDKLVLNEENAEEVQENVDEGFKRRVGNSEDDRHAVAADEKRQRLLSALGEDDNSKKSAWTEAKQRFDWLQPDKIRDGKGRRASDEEYDWRTVRVPSSLLASMSASQRQYWDTKCQYMDVVLFFKVGKFYELYEIDAEIGHKEMGWKLTVTGVGRCRQVGVPESGIDEAIRKLVGLGYKVGRMEQVETAAEAKERRGNAAVVKRALVKVFTPATVTDDFVRPEAYHLLAVKESPSPTAGGSHSVELGEVMYGFAFVDAAAGNFFLGTIKDDESRGALGALLQQINPQEVLFEKGCLSPETKRALARASGPGLLPLQLTPLLPTSEFIDAQETLRRIHKNSYFHGSTNSFDLDDLREQILQGNISCEVVASALGAVISHLQRMKFDIELLRHGDLRRYEVYAGSLRLDGQTLVNLELLGNSADHGKAGTLLGHLDTCVTPAGKRLIRRWICHPLRSITAIEARLDAVDVLLADFQWATETRSKLRRLPDLERSLGRIRRIAAGLTVEGASMGVASKLHEQRMRTFGSTVRAISDTLFVLMTVRKEVERGRADKRSALLESLTSIPLKERAACGVLDEIEGILELKPSSKTTTQWSLRVEEGGRVEAEEEWEWEARALSELLVLFNGHMRAWTEIAQAATQIDVLIAFGQAARASAGACCRPTFVACQASEGGLSASGCLLNLQGLWHPYAVGGGGGAVVPNDVVLGPTLDGTTAPRAMLLTGPNMGGKSTLLRATCVAVIMAQLGCYVPAARCTMSVVDTIFTRLGASDRIMSGESTFMVECNEAASVLRHATPQSLVILDELGRGTSTFDGYAIAYAVLKHLTETLDCRLLFATHYHPLNDEFAKSTRVKLLHMASALRGPTGDQEVVLEEHQAPAKATMEMDGGILQPVEGLSRDQLVFLYKLREGPCPKSYGLHVALLAGIPESVVHAASRSASRMCTTMGPTHGNAHWQEAGVLGEGIASTGAFGNSGVYTHWFSQLLVAQGAAHEWHSKVLSVWKELQVTDLTSP